MSLEKLDELLYTIGLKRLSAQVIGEEMISVTYEVKGKEMTFTAKDAAKFNFLQFFINPESMADSLILKNFQKKF